MNRATMSIACLLAGLSGAMAAQGQGQESAPAAPDPRVGLKAGLTDAGQAARGLELVASVPKPPGFDDPQGRGGLAFSNSDLAFQRTLVIQGNFNGMNFFDVEDPTRPQVRTSVTCPGGQGDVSVFGHLLFMSVEETRGRIDCGVAPPPPARASNAGPGEEGAAVARGRGRRGPAPDPMRFRGVRIFDISNPLSPKQVAAVQTCRGSHTHTLVTSPKDKSKVYVYAQGTASVRSAEELTGCSSGDPTANPETSLYTIDVIEVPLASPEKARIVNHPRIFADPATGTVAGLWPGGSHGGGTQTTSATNQCHDITAYPAIGLAAGACAGNGILLDISDPVHPTRVDDVIDPSFAYWHSASFNNDGTKVIFTDEWGGGTQPRCRATDSLTWGADAIYTIVNRRLKFASYYKMPAAQTEQENCVAHNGSLIPVPGRDIEVQAWYQGGASVFDFTDASHPVEIAYFDRGPVDATRLVLGGYWSTYWYDGYIYASEIARGLDVLKLLPSDLLSQNEIDAAKLVVFDEFNVQSQPRFTWPASFVVARAYLDQLARSRGLAPERIEALMSAMADLDAMPAGGARRDAADRLVALASQLDRDAAAARPLEAKRMRECAATIKARSNALR